MTAIEKVKAIQGILEVVQDGDFKTKSYAALNALVAEADRELKPPKPDDGILRGTGDWAFVVRIDGDDLVVDDCRATCFGGSDDPQDSGATASGISTKDNPNLAAVSLPMDFGDACSNTKGSPIPRLPWKTLVRVESGKTLGEFPLIDIGPARKTGNAIDLSIAAARFFNRQATARSFEMRCSFRILGGAKFVK